MLSNIALDIALLGLPGDWVRSSGAEPAERAVLGVHLGGRSAEREHVELAGVGDVHQFVETAILLLRVVPPDVGSALNAVGTIRERALASIQDGCAVFAEAVLVCSICVDPHGVLVDSVDAGRWADHPVTLDTV